MSQTKSRVLDGRRQVVVPCPRCGTPMGMWLNLLDGEDRDRLLARYVDITAAMSPPEDRQATMGLAADTAEKAWAVPWVDCSCGYSGIYTYGGGAR